MLCGTIPPLPQVHGVLPWSVWGGFCWPHPWCPPLPSLVGLSCWAPLYEAKEAHVLGGAGQHEKGEGMVFNTLTEYFSFNLLDTKLLRPMP